MKAIMNNIYAKNFNPFKHSSHMRMSIGETTSFNNSSFLLSLLLLLALLLGLSGLV